jgi:hypothetical protein
MQGEKIEQLSHTKDKVKTKAEVVKGQLSTQRQNLW